MGRSKPKPGAYAAGDIAPRPVTKLTVIPVPSRKNEVVSHSVAALSVSPEERHLRIQLAAYRRAESRGFEAGREHEDWLAAEREIDSDLND